MFMIELKDVAWWYWLTISCLINVSVFGAFDVYNLVIAVSVVHLIHYIIRESSLTAFSVQVRIAFLCYVVVAYPEEMRWLYWVPAIGSMARVLFGYCLLARALMLLPANRQVPISWDYIANAFFSAPVRGSVLHGLGKY